MNFFKKIIGFGNEDIKKTASSSKFTGSLYRVVKDARSIIFPKCTIAFQFPESESLIIFNNEQPSNNKNSTYAFPFHQSMNLVNYEMNKGGSTNACFQWSLDESGDHVGFFVDPKNKEKVKQILCKILKQLLNDENITDHLKLCKQLNGIPIYKASQQKQSNYGSKISEKSQKNVEINEILLKQASKDENRMVNSGSCYQIINKERKVLNSSVIFIIKESEPHCFQFHLINATGYTFLKKQINHSLIYDVNTDQGYIKWVQAKENFKIIQVNFQGRRDVAMSLKFAIVQYLYETNTKKKLEETVAQDQLNYIKNVSQNKQEITSKNIVKTYEHNKQEIDMQQAKFIYESEQATKGLEKYTKLCQGKIHNFDVACLGSMLETLKISEDNKIKQVSKRIIKGQNGKKINIDDIVLHDRDQKAVLNDEYGDLHYYDMEKGSIIKTYKISDKGIMDICPEYKLADIKEYKNLKAISKNSIYQIDPRIQDGIANSKSYQTNTQFNKISVDSKGNFAVSSQNGQIRLFNEIGKNANCKYPTFGQPVLHLESTKDGKWLLATFKNFLLLMPTVTEEDESLYENKIKISKRLNPIKLSIKFQHLQLCKVKDLKMIPAKFDERKGDKEMFIVSGFGQYVVIWNLAQVIKGERDNYKFTNVDGEIIQTQFMFDNVKKLIMTTSSGIVIKENKIRS